MSQLPPCHSRLSFNRYGARVNGPYLPPHLFGGEDFGNEYLNSLNFAVEFNFGLEFSGAYNADYFAGDVEYDGMSVDCLRDDVDAPATSSSRKKRRPNRQ